MFRPCSQSNYVAILISRFYCKKFLTGNRISHNYLRVNPHESEEENPMIRQQKENHGNTRRAFLRNTATLAGAGLATSFTPSSAKTSSRPITSREEPLIV